MNTKRVLLPIVVPSRDYCWEYNPPFAICAYFDNTGGHVSCALGFREQKDRPPHGTLKDPKCKLLQEEEV